VNTRNYTTTDEIDQRFVWIDKEIEIAGRKADDASEPNRDKFKNRAANLKHQKSLLLRRRNLLLTPALL